MRRTILFLLLLLGSRWPAVAQTGFEAALMQTTYGATLVFTSKEQTIQLRIVTPKLEPLPNPGFMKVNGQLLQARLLDAPIEATAQPIKQAQAQKYLLAYQAHESHYIRDELKQQITHEQVRFLYLGAHLFMFWEYTMPASDEQLQRQQYLVSLCFNQTLVLNCPVETTANPAATKELLTNIGQLLELKNAPTDLEKLYYQVTPGAKKN